LRLLGWLAAVGVCTAGQAARFAFDGDPEHAYRELEDLRARRLVGRIDRIALPKSCGPARLARPYYLREEARKVLGWADEALAGEARCGRPAGYELSRVPRLLGVAESYLWWIDRGYGVLDFRPNLPAKTAGRGARRRRRHRAALPWGGDYEVLLARPGFNGEVVRHRCAVAVDYSREAIRRQTRDLVWFAFDDVHEARVSHLSGVRPKPLGDLCEPRPEDEIESFVGPLRDEIPAPVESALGVMRLLGGAATAEGVMAVAGGHRSNVSRALAKAERERLVSRARVRLCSGSEKGRPYELYSLGPEGGMTRDAAVHSLLVSKAAAYMVGHGYAPRKFWPRLRTLLVRHRWRRGETAYLCVVDDPGLLVEELEALAVRARREIQAGKSLLVVAVADPYRRQVLLEINPERIVWDVAQPVAHESLFK
jgi:hypothetical protein